MFDFFHSLNFQAALDFLSANPHIVGIFTYCIVFLESMAVIGAIVPGAIVMPAIGFLIGSSVVPVGSTFSYAIIGAITGDCLSYFIGSYFKNRIHKMWPFTRWPNLLNHGEKFFHNHGGKSIFIGRFVGPTRAVIPMVVGMLNMRFLRFFFISIPSASVWAVSYMMPGVLLGALSLELPPKLAAEFAAWGLLILVILWFSVWLMQHFFRQIWRMTDYYIMRFWRYLQRHKESSWLTKMLSDPKSPDNHLQLTLLVGAFFAFILFLYILYQVLVAGGLTDLSYSIYHLLRSIRSVQLDHILLAITFFGDIRMLLVASGIVMLWLIRNKHWYVAFHFLSVIFLSGITASVLKLFFHSPRPGDIMYDIHGSSFPSAHVAFSLSFYGFLAVIITDSLKSAKKHLVYLGVALLVVAIAFSRIFLGAHWLVDVLSGILLALMLVLIVTISYRRRHITNLRGRKFMAVVGSVFIAVWAGFVILDFDRQLKNYTLNWPEQTISLAGLTEKHMTVGLPLYRLNRLGRSIEAFNVVYIGDLKKIGRALSGNGWQMQPTILDFQGIIKSFSKTSIAHHLSIFPQLYRNKRIALLFTKKTKQQDVVLVLRLWASGVNLKDGCLPLWIGAVEHHHARPKVFSLRNFRKKPQFVGATDYLAKNLSKDFYLQKKYYSIKEQPDKMRDLHWNGKLLIIQELDS